MSLKLHHAVLRYAVVALAFTTLAAAAQDQQQTANPAPDAVITNAPPASKKKTRKEKVEKPKKDEKIQQSKETRKDLKRLKKDNPLAGLDSTQPDKQLYDKSMVAMKKGKFDVARLELQTLLATYPDSEYQMRAKLAFADSWYKEGGSAALMQAEQEYKDFITFFPNAPEAAEAQLRVGDIFFKQIDTPDRDYTKALRAQDEYRNMLQQFPDSPLTADARQRLRETQEILATRETNIASFYATRDNYSAAIARYQTVADAYPLYSHVDEVLIGLGDAYAAQARMIRAANLPEGPKARLVKIYEDQAAATYDRVVTQYAAAPHVEDARDRLDAMGRTIPAPTPEQLAASKALEDSRAGYSLKNRAILLVKRGPDVVQVAHIGEPSLADPKPTLAPSITRQAEANFKAAFDNKTATMPADVAPTKPAEPVSAAGVAPPSSTPPASTAAPTLQDIPSADAPANTGSAVDMSAPAATSPATGGSNSSVGVQILSPGATTTPAADGTLNSTKVGPNGLPVVGPVNTAMPAAEAPAAAPDQVNDVAGKTTPAAEQAPDQTGKKKKKNPKPGFDNDDESSSKHHKKKGIKKLNPF